MSAAAQFDIRALLETAGACIRGHNRADCPECGRLRAVSFNESAFCCHGIDCNFRGGIGTLRERLGLRREWLPRHEYLCLRREREQADQEARAIQEKRQAAARRLAEAIWAKATPASPSHVYLARKNVKAHGVRVHAGQLVVPIRDVDGNLHSLEFISQAGDKQFLKGGRVKGCCYEIGKLNGSIFLTEGYATGTTIFEATGEAVAVCFFAGNLHHVAVALRGMYQKAELIIAADNDREKPGNPGLTAAKATARRFGLRALWPEFAEGEQGSDFNDLAALIGTDAVRKHLYAALRSETR